MRRPPKPYRESVERKALDKAAATCMAITGSPLAVVTAAALCLESGTLNPFFKQHRIGVDEKEFLLTKFRTIYPAFGENPDEVKTFGSEDPRATPVGSLLRRVGFDEWPQWWNVMRGDLSMNGARPQIKTVRDEREATAREYGFYDVFETWENECCRVRLGLFGAGQSLAHRMGRYAETDPHAIEPIMMADIVSEATASLENDIKAIVETPLGLARDALMRVVRSTQQVWQ